MEQMNEYVNGWVADVWMNESKLASHWTHTCLLPCVSVCLVARWGKWTGLVTANQEGA